MAFWSSEKIKENQAALTLIFPFDENRLKHGCYELSLGPETFVTSEETGKKQKIEIGDQVRIPPGQFGLLLAKEKITIPSTTIGFISVKASIKFRGLVNVSGFHVDPGFSGHLKFSVYNAGSQSIVLTYGEPLFLIWFSDLDRETKDVYNGKHAGQCEISSEDVMRIQGEVASPSALNERLKAVEDVIRVAKMFFWGLLLALFIWFVRDVVLKQTVEQKTTISLKEQKALSESPRNHQMPMSNKSSVQKPTSTGQKAK
jgi:dCTP deaminase